MKKNFSRIANCSTRILLDAGIIVGLFGVSSAFAGMIGVTPGSPTSGVQGTGTAAFLPTTHEVAATAGPVAVLFPQSNLEIPLGGSEAATNQAELNDSGTPVGESPGDAFAPLLSEKYIGVKAEIENLAPGVSLAEKFKTQIKVEPGPTQQPCIDVLNEVSLDGGGTFFDANATDSSPVTRAPATAEFRIRVTNCGAVDLDKVRIEDQTLGIDEILSGSLSANETRTLDKKDIPALGLIVPVCEGPDEVFTIAGVSAESKASGELVRDSDPAVVICAGEPCIDLLTEVSVDGGETFFDANDDSTAVTTTITEGNAKYRLTVSNCGTVGLADVTINDRELGILDYPAGKLPVSANHFLVGSDVSALSPSGRCKVPGKLINMATVRGRADPAEPQADGVSPNVTDIDPAVLICESESESPRIKIMTEVSVDRGQTYFDANQRPDAPATERLPSAAIYRVTVSNPGPIDLVDVVVNDPDLGVVDYSVGDLTVNRSIVLSAGRIPALRQRVRCKAPGVVNNIATVMGASAHNPDQRVVDSDPAVVICSHNGINGKVRSMATMMPWLWVLRPSILIER